MFDGLIELAGTVCAFLVAVGIVIFVHELGHYLAARFSGISVKVFSVGFGRPVVAWRDSRGTIWQVGILPLGGYVRFADAGESAIHDAASGQQEGDSLSMAPLWHRIITVSAGPLANFVFSSIVFAVLALSIGLISGDAVVGKLRNLPGVEHNIEPGDRITALDGVEVNSLADLYVDVPMEGSARTNIYSIDRGGSLFEAEGPVPMPPVISTVRLMSAAADAGLQEGDVVLAVDGNPIRSFAELRRAVEDSAGQPLDLEVWRAGEVFDVSLQGRKETISLPGGGFEERILVGVNGGLFFEPVTVKPAPLDAMLIGSMRTLGVITGTIDGVGAIISAQISSCNIQGPVGIARVSGQAASQGTFEFVSLVAVISAVIGFLNLLPIPGLDGGHLVFYAYEAVFRRKLSNSFQRTTVMLGFALVVMLMAFGLFNDLTCA